VFLLCSLTKGAALSSPANHDADWIERCAHICEQLAERGMELAEEAAAKAKQAFAFGTTAEQKTHTLLFTRLSRVVRQAIALEIRLRNGQVVRATPAPLTRPTPLPPSPKTPSGQPPCERLDANFAHLSDDEIPSLLQAIGAELGVTVEIPGRARARTPQHHVPHAPPLAASQHSPAARQAATGPPR